MKKKVKMSNVFHLIQYVQYMIISTYSQQKKESMRYFRGF